MSVLHRQAGTAIDGVLGALGVTAGTLDVAQRRSLDVDGFVTLSDALAPEALVAVRAALDRLVVTAAGASTDEPGTVRVHDLVARGPAFDVCWTHPRLLAAVRHVLRDDFRVESVTARVALPRDGHQALHVDWPAPVAPGEAPLCTAVWFLDEVTETGGGTRVVPGSHLRGRIPDATGEAACLPADGEVRVAAPAGSVVVFHGHVWHSGTLNERRTPSRTIHARFVRARHAPAGAGSAPADGATVARLTPAARHLLGAGRVTGAPRPDSHPEGLR